MGKVWDVLAPRNLELGPLAGSASGQGHWRNWKLARDDNGIAWLVLDKPGSSANLLSEDVLVELDDVLATLERDLPKGVILRSGKPGGFIAGADIHEFSGMTDVAAVETRLTHGNAIVDRLDHLAVPTVAVIHGYCLGGGLEIALACYYRVAVDDAVTTERHVKAAASAAIERQLKTRRGGMLIDIVNSTYGRKLAVKRMRTETAKKAPAAYYPAPYALISLWENHGGNPQDMAKAEIASFARLMVTATSRNLVRVVFLREKLKALADGDGTGQHVHVIGAGAMGS